MMKEKREDVSLNWRHRVLEVDISALFYKDQESTSTTTLVYFFKIFTFWWHLLFVITCWVCIFRF